MQQKSLIKICGLSTPDTLNAALNKGADWVGLVFFEKSPRHVSLEKAANLANLARGKAQIVALTVNASRDALNTISEIVEPDIFQLHGSERPNEVLGIQECFQRPVIKAIGVREKADLEAIAAYQNIANYILLDAKPPENANLPGGNGVPFDWDILKELPDDFDYLLSGGLTSNNVTEAFASLNPYGFDVSSGVESTAGVKDINLIERFIDNARS